MPKLTALQSLRALAALLVVFDHVIGPTAGHGIAREPLYSLMLFLGQQGVSIFFLISGFIMTYTADLPVDTDSPRSRATNFFLRRVVRVVPLYWCFTFLIAIPAFIGSYFHPIAIKPIYLVKSLLFIPYVDGYNNMTPMFFIGWSLNYEMFFYALFAMILMLPHRFRIGTLFATLSIMVATGAFYYPVLTGRNAKSPGEFLTSPLLLLFGIGAVVGWIKLKWPTLHLRVPGIPLVLPLFAINIAIFLIKVRATPVPLPWNTFFWMFDLAILIVCAFGRPLALPRLEALGDASYSLYLSHLVPFFLCGGIWYGLLHSTMSLLYVLVAVPVCIITGFATYRWIERPLTRATGRLLTPKPKPIPPPALVEAELQQA